MNIKKGENVEILAGDDKGKTGKVLRVLNKQNTVIVEGVRLAKKHQRPKKSSQKGQIIDKAMPVHISNVILVSSNKKKTSAVKASSSKSSNKSVRKNSK